jgi:hypothetical protein
MKATRVLTNSIIVIVATMIGLLVCEILARFILNPADFLSVSMVKHEILGGVIAPGSPGFDNWGFRNKTVPAEAEIVAIGDSHTYGNTARMEESWPSVLSHMTGKTVYNMGLGGYGPNQYDYLLKTHVLSLRPRIVLCGLYMGDDFENAFLITYGLDYWAYLRQKHFEGVESDIWQEPYDPRLFKEIRIWLSRNSVLYKIVFHGPVLGRIKGYFQIGNVSRSHDAFVTSLILEDRNIREAFRPVEIRRRLNQKNDAVREGMRITFELLKDVKEECHKSDSQLIVVVIPTKEMVFAEYLEHNPKIHLGDVIDDLISNERMARKELFEFFRAAGIGYVDTLPALKSAVGQELYVRTDRDMHPGKNGYRVIAEAVKEYLESSRLLH